jgi:hypothetical protein
MRSNRDFTNDLLNPGNNGNDKKRKSRDGKGNGNGSAVLGGGRKEQTRFDLKDVARMDKELREQKRQKDSRGGNNKERGDQPFAKKRKPQDEEGEDDTDTNKPRDRAAERRRGINPDYDMQTVAAVSALETEKTKFFGGDISTTHLVRGLDYSLLRKQKETVGPKNTTTSTASSSSSNSGDARMHAGHGGGSDSEAENEKETNNQNEVSLEGARCHSEQAESLRQQLLVHAFASVVTETETATSLSSSSSSIAPHSARAAAAEAAAPFTSALIGPSVFFEYRLGLWKDKTSDSDFVKAKANPSLDQPENIPGENISGLGLAGEKPVYDEIPLSEKGGPGHGHSGPDYDFVPAVVLRGTRSRQAANNAKSLALADQDDTKTAFTAAAGEDTYARYEPRPELSDWLAESMTGKKTNLSSSSSSSSKANTKASIRSSDNDKTANSETAETAGSRQPSTEAVGQQVSTTCSSKSKPKATPAHIKVDSIFDDIFLSSEPYVPSTGPMDVPSKKPGSHNTALPHPPPLPPPPPPPSSSSSSTTTAAAAAIAKGDYARVRVESAAFGQSRDQSSANGSKRAGDEDHHHHQGEGEKAARLAPVLELLQKQRQQEQAKMRHLLAEEGFLSDTEIETDTGAYIDRGKGSTDNGGAGADGGIDAIGGRGGEGGGGQAQKTQRQGDVFGLEGSYDMFGGLEFTSGYGSDDGSDDDDGRVRGAGAGGRGRGRGGGGGGGGRGGRGGGGGEGGRRVHKRGNKKKP